MRRFAVERVQVGTLSKEIGKAVLSAARGMIGIVKIAPELSPE